MKNRVFLDTGGLVAMTVSAEERHLLACEVFEKLEKNGCELYTTDHVMEEVVTWLRCRGKYEVIEIFQFLHNLYVTDLNVIEAGRERFSNALILMHKFRDHQFSMTDCLSFVVMKELKIKDVFTTDKHFTIAGFNNLLNQNL